MHADELRSAVRKVVEILDNSQIRAVVDQYRSSQGDQRTAAAARLGHAGALIMEELHGLSAAERQVVRCLHLESLGGTDYWQSLLAEGQDPRKHQAEIVRLASRVMFATSHLPGLISLLEKTTATALTDDIAVPELQAGEGGLYVRLTDAGEKAADPDRIARSIDGIDMLYSACASIARKPAMDLRLDGILARRNQDRELHFIGERDAVAAVHAVIDSIPAVLAEIDPEQEIDLDSVVQALPVFEDLNTLASLGTFSRKDLKDISDTMHQGALLTLESGVILVDQAVRTANPPQAAASKSVATTHGDEAGAQTHHPLDGDRVAPSGSSGNSGETGGVAESPDDEHYDRYLREREAMRQGKDDELNGHIPVAPAAAADADTGHGEDQLRREAVDELLKSLEQSRRS